MLSAINKFFNAIIETLVEVVHSVTKLFNKTKDSLHEVMNDVNSLRNGEDVDLEKYDNSKESRANMFYKEYKAYAEKHNLRPDYVEVLIARTTRERLSWIYDNELFPFTMLGGDEVLFVNKEWYSELYQNRVYWGGVDASYQANVAYPWLSMRQKLNRFGRQTREILRVYVPHEKYINTNIVSIEKRTPSHRPRVSRVERSYYGK